MACWQETLLWGLRETFACQVNTSQVNVEVEMLPYPSCAESVPWDLFFPDFFYGQVEGGGREESTWQQMSPSIIWEAVEGSAGPEGKGFCVRASVGQDCLEMLQWIYSELVTFPVLYTVHRPDSWGCCVLSLCHFTSCMLVSTSKAACFILKLNDFTDIP